jgi:uncharacterized metal-binding protein YceD (DUF177 family)
MNDDAELGWHHKITDIRDRRSFTRDASEAECAMVSQIFNGVECLALSAAYEVVPLSPGRYRVRGEARATIEQVCGVSLDPLQQQIDEDFDIEFRAGARRGNDHGVDFDAIDFDAMAEDDPEPIEHGEIRIGRFICEVVASAIDPSPRAEDAELDKAEAAGETGRTNPFAALAKLKGNT